MKLRYKTLWIDDEPESIEPNIDDIAEYLEELGFIFEPASIFSEYKEIQSLTLNSYDLLLIDYHLTNENGDQIIRQIRDKDIFTNVVFYSSSEPKILREAVFNAEIDGVYCVNRESVDMVEKIKSIIDVNIKKVQHLSNVRGLMITEMCDLENKLLQIIRKYIGVLGTDKSPAYISEIKEKLCKSYNERIVKINSDDIDILSSNLFEAYSKFQRVMGISKKNGLVNTELREVLKLFNDEVISIRNILAHVKETLAESGETIISYKDFIFDENKCIEIRKNLKKHHENLNAIFNIIS